MAPEKVNSMNKILAWIFGGGFAVVSAIFLAGGFYSTTSANNKTLPQHIEEDKQINMQRQAFETAALVKFAETNGAINLLTAEIKRMNDNEEKFHHKQHGQ